MSNLQSTLDYLTRPIDSTLQRVAELRKEAEDFQAQADARTAQADELEAHALRLQRLTLVLQGRLPLPTPDGVGGHGLALQYGDLLIAPPADPGPEDLRAFAAVMRPLYETAMTLARQATDAADAVEQRGARRSTATGTHALAIPSGWAQLTPVAGAPVFGHLSLGPEGVTVTDENGALVGTWPVDQIKRTRTPESKCGCGKPLFTGSAGGYVHADDSLSCKVAGVPEAAHV